jgi:hypothetical protein
MRTVARLAVAGVLVLSLAGCTAVGQASRDLARRLVGGDGGGSSSSDGSGGSAGGTDWTALRVGDCFDDSDDDSTVPLRDCAKHHDNEVYALLTEPGDDYPGDVAVDKWARANCQTALEKYDGLAFIDSTLDFSYSTPAAENWEAGDTVTICYAYDWNYDQLVGSVKGKKL